MTGEEIEKTLKCCDSKDWKCDECPIAKKCKKMAGDISFFHRQVIKYINRLKAEKEQIRKETAKEILIMLKVWCDRETTLNDDIQELAQKYGVEVENEISS